MAYNTIERGRLNTTDYRVFITNCEGKPISPFHDIPLFANEEAKICNMVVEIPRWTNHKMEICKEEPLNPIKQDVKKGKVRFVKNCFPHHGYIWNYGAMPQTWEDVDHVEDSTNTKGDNDPLDVCEIGQTVHKRGAVIQVKVLGVMCLIDEGETDWKIICIDVNDPLADQLNDIADIETLMPGFIKATREWFTVYKIPDGKPANKFAYDGEAKNREFALRVIQETHEQWKKLVGEDGNVTRGDINCQNVCVGSSPFKIEQDACKEIVEKSSAVGAPDTLPEDVDKWHYIPASAL
ncbi:Inorganic pyrophosphatase [Mactra antiquata]